MTTNEYKTLHANEPSKLDKQVSEALQQGYRLHGGPYTIHTPAASSTLFCQVVVSSDVQSALPGHSHSSTQL
jgi:hypothetical protein